MINPIFAKDCSFSAQKIAAEQGGYIKKTEDLIEYGKHVCVVVIFIPVKNGEKQRRVEIALPIQ
ncbi:MAG: hypothetical protein JSC161_000254 [Candidatus Tokpelaia sp. JSC161]|jgi:hypothetical protein|nr:MAG: hypothetical protein JSC161_000254 [Candidatus Tokpelaia sp. JSC161]